MLGLQEIFNGPYFCPSQDAHWYDMAEPVPGPTTERMAEYARKFRMVMVVPVYEREQPGVYYNTAAVYDADGRFLGKYRKNHIPHTAGFWEKYFFKPGNLGYPVFETQYARVGVYICYDRHFPKGRACSACTGPRSCSTRRRPSRACRSTCGSSSSRRTRSPTATSWRAATGWAPRRPGTSAASTARPTSSIRAGNFLATASEDKDELITATLDLDQIEEVRRVWQFYRDRRPETYAAMAELCESVVARDFSRVTGRIIESERAPTP